LPDVFGDKIISSGISSACSTNLIIVFFPWSYLKDKVYNGNTQTEEIKENIHKEMANIPAEQLQIVNQNLFCCCKEYLHVEG
jgi:hypothetical protein